MPIPATGATETSLFLPGAATKHGATTAARASIAGSRRSFRIGAATMLAKVLEEAEVKLEPGFLEPNLGVCRKGLLYSA